MTRARTVAIVQARMGSTRRPDKVLAQIEGGSMLARVVRRTQRAELVDQVVVATSETVEDDAIVKECAGLDVDCFRGKEQDVLDRFHQAATTHAAKAIVRITADCPMIDPKVIDRVIEAFHRESADYASNVIERKWPRGLDTEVFSYTTLERAWHEAHQPHERVHVTPYIYGHPEQFRLLSVPGPVELGHWRWTVDTPEDLEFVRNVYAHFDGDDRFSWQDVADLVRREQSLSAINRHIRQKDLHEG